MNSIDKLMIAIKDKEKNQWVIIGIVLFCILVAVYYVFNLNKTSEIVELKKEPVQFASSIQHGDLKSYFTNQINKQIKEQKQAVKAVEENFASSTISNEKEMEELRQQNQRLEEKLNELITKLDHNTIQTNNHSNAINGDFGNPDYDPNIIPSQYGQINLPPLNKSTPMNLLSTDEIELVSTNLVNSQPKFKNIKTYVPAGTYVKAVVIGGVDANTEVNGASGQTKVVTVRLIDSGNIPGGYKSVLKDCTLLASAYGVASSERVALRGERLTCVAANGNVLETDIIASIYGADGRQDARGRMVYPENKLLSRAFVAGSLSGIGSGIANSMSSQSISPLGATSVIPGEDIFKYGAAQGVGKGLDKLADYYIKRAEQLQPVVQLGSGSLVTVVVQKGFYLDGQNHTEVVSETPQSPFDKPKSTNNRQEANEVLANIKETF